MAVFGGAEERMGGRRPVDGAVYDPAADRWRPVPPPKPPAGLEEGWPVAWTGRELIVAGRQSGRHRWRAYRPDGDGWRVLAPPPAAAPWDLPAAAWTGSDLLAWGAVYNCRGDCTQSVIGQAGFRLTAPS